MHTVQICSTKFSHETRRLSYIARHTVAGSSREQICYKHYSPRTERAYVKRVRMFVKWHGLRHLRDRVQVEIERFLGMLPWNLQPAE